MASPPVKNLISFCGLNPLLNIISHLEGVDCIKLGFDVSTIFEICSGSFDAESPTKINLPPKINGAKNSNNEMSKVKVVKLKSLRFSSKCS